MGGSESLPSINPKITLELQRIFQRDGIDQGHRFFAKELKNVDSDYLIDESELNGLGYAYLRQDEFEQALAIFKMNIQAFPESFNPYDSYGEALLAYGVRNYKKSLELNPQNDNAVQVLEKMGIMHATGDKESPVSVSDYSKYVGTYSLAPTFEITITLHGDQLSAQATGQGRNNIYPISKNRFELRVVDAQIEFFSNDEGEIISMTLFQGGQEMPGGKIK